MNESLKNQIFDQLNYPILVGQMTRFSKEASARIRLVEEEIRFFHPFNKDLNQRYQFFRSFQFLKETKEWKININKMDIEIAKFILDLNQLYAKYSWEIDSETCVYLDNFIKDFEVKQLKHKEIMKVKRSKDIADFEWESYLKKEPLKHQKVGIRFLELNNGIAFIGDDMGLGKTMQSIAYTAKHNLKTLVVCPNTLKYNWDREIKDFSYKKPLVVTELDPNDPIKKLDYDYFIVNYEQLDKYFDLLKKQGFDCIIVDEAHFVKSTKTNRYKTLSKFKKINHRILLSGTAIKNKIIEFYTQLKFLRPDLFPTKEKFGMRYCDAKINPFGYGFVYNGASNLKELTAKISSFYIRRIKTEELDLPEKIISIVDLEVDAELSKKISMINQNVKKEFKGQISSNKLAVLGKLIKLKQILSLAKLKQLKELVDMQIDSPGKILIFSQFIETQKKLVALFGSENICSIFSEHTPLERDEAQQEFKNNDKKRIMICSTLIGSVGLNITSADKVFFVDLLWNDADHKQSEDRVYRIGQTRSVNIYYMIYKDSIESDIWNLFAHKSSTINPVLADKEKNDSIEDSFYRLYMEKTIKNQEVL